MQLFQKILYQDIKFFEEKKVGELVTRIRSDVSQIQLASTNQVISIIRNIIISIGTLIYLITISYHLCLILLLIVPFFFIQTSLLSKKMKLLNRKSLIFSTGLSNIAEECFSNIKAIKIFAQEKREFLNFKRLINKKYDNNLLKSILSGIEQAAGIFFSSVLVILVLVVGGMIIQSAQNQGRLTIGKIASFMMSALHLASSISSLTKSYSQISYASAVGENIFQILDSEQKIKDKENSISGNKINGKIEFQNVEFSYPSSPTIKILNNFSLIIQPGEVIGIVGQSGAGKSTLLNLLIRFNDINNGSIMIDNIDIRDYKQQFLREIIGYVPQEPTLFNGTIKENICYGINDFNDDEMIKNAEIANAHNFIINKSIFPNGYETLIAERGENISVGQKQRITIARALMKHPSILLFDEATSSLDAESEFLVQSSIEKLMKQRNITIVIVAHRLSTIKQCDKIVVISNGQIAEQGTHQELIDRGQIYSELIQRQLFSEN